MLLLPVLFFLVLEGGLRLAGYGEDYPLFVEVEGAPGYLMPSRDVAHRYFARQAAVPTPNPDFFAADKPEGVFRIIAQGGSSAAGFPFYRGASFPQVLGARLRLAYPEAEVEVVNTAMAAVNSYTLLDLADEVIAQDPDAVVIYAGHNEFYGALGAASTESLGRSPALVRLFLRLRDWRTVQFVRDLVVGVVGAVAERPAGAPPSSTLMAQMIGEQSVPLGGETYRAGLRQFSENLDRLLAAYAEAGVPVYVSTLASNERDQRPFVTAHAAGADTAAWGRAVRAGVGRLEAGDAAGAVPILRQAVGIDPGAAGAHFALGRAYLALGQTDSARAALGRARDLDALRFRAPQAFNDVVRQSAARHGAVPVEGEAALRAASPDGLVGREAMLEHLHPTLDGYAALADAFFDAIVADRLVSQNPPRPTPPGRAVRAVAPLDSLAGLLRVAQLTAAWPFRPDEAQPFRLDTARTPPYALDAARQAMAGADWREVAGALAARYEQDGRLADALATRRAVARAYPFSAGAWSDLAALELRRAQEAGRPLAEATALYEEALERDPGHVPALAMLGALALQNGDRDRAIGYLERARTAAPDTPQILYNLSGAYMMEGRMGEATALAERLVALDPQNAGYRTYLASLRRSAGAGAP